MSSNNNLSGNSNELFAIHLVEEFTASETDFRISRMKFETDN